MFGSQTSRYFQMFGNINLYSAKNLMFSLRCNVFSCLHYHLTTLGELFRNDRSRTLAREVTVCRTKYLHEQMFACASNFPVLWFKWSDLKKLLIIKEDMFWHIFIVLAVLFSVTIYVSCFQSEIQGVVVLMTSIIYNNIWCLFRLFQHELGRNQF